MIKSALAVALAAAAIVPSGAAAHARSVSLTDASSAPSYLRLLQPGSGVTKTRQCPRGQFYSDVNAYRWNGHALAPQRWNAAGDVMTWGRVKFDGITFHNGGRRPVLVAAWCE